ncbi:EbsA family protein [Enterococcus diestrammenae]|uniref:EbsA family protein n=1 Tax=Enterococcus diestrammenae TaxID=1155073 RepID=UPI0022E42AF3|nr:EbsA family protein [Enterococcus diestrammenae]
MNTKRYHWQPELAISIIYWSLTLMVLFYSLTLSLENTRPYWKSNLVLAAFALLIVIGCRRTMFFGEDRLLVRYARFWKWDAYYLEDMKEITLNPNGLSFVYEGVAHTFIFRKKTLIALKVALYERFPEDAIKIVDQIEIR